ncbi:hypothetical protein KV205_09805 [Streptomyces sp. SKN60]|uniref:hypothetical protein n=1 Tax=Streptomyces sp. SKN60 TaxID=2855506 RepID=UPI0022451361|nr:hypothetical protein [Streptomyces sp. SKN60]MCX2180821.1 hypothetical protein [Streptomyces sp. SKN60]
MTTAETRAPEPHAPHAPHALHSPRCDDVIVPHYREPRSGDGLSAQQRAARARHVA